jgi:hypothetical protein
LHTVVAVADIQKVTEITETLEAWDLVMEIKTVVDLVAVEDLTTDSLTAQAVAVAELEMQALMQDAQQFKMELVHLLVKEDSVLVLEHLAVALVHLITGLHGLELVAEAEMVCMELQAVAEAEDQQVEVDLAEVAQEAHRQLITLVEQEWTAQALAVAEITTQVETAKREVLA